jgi:hypothetical protein
MSPIPIPWFAFKPVFPSPLVKTENLYFKTPQTALDIDIYRKGGRGKMLEVLGPFHLRNGVNVVA